ncbi:MAG: hypothetical protein AAB262_14080, partial [Elusimicrobiota bacterium]
MNQEDVTRPEAFFRDCGGRLVSAVEVCEWLYRFLPPKRLTARQVGRMWRRSAHLIRQGLLPDQVHAYVYIPFCHRYCTYCNLYVVQLRDAAQLEEYVDRLLKQFEFFRPY